MKNTLNFTELKTKLDEAKITKGNHITVNNGKMLDRKSLELMKINKENFYATCINDLHIGKVQFKVGEIIHITESQKVELEVYDEMVIYIIENSDIGLCDIELDENFIIN